MTESIKFGPEWLRNSVANVVATPPSQQHQQHHHHLHQNQQSPQQQQSPSSDSIISRPVLSDHRYGREEMLSLCDKSARLPDALPRFRRLFVADWQTPLALQPITDDEQIGSRGLGGTGAPSSTWGGTHIRPLMPAMGGRGGSVMRGGAIERGSRGRGRGGLYHGSSYTRSTSLYDEDGNRQRWLDRNGGGGGGASGTDVSSTEWSAGSSVSPRKEGFSRSALESWRKGTREENEEGWRSSSNGTNSATPVGGREKWARSTSWRDGSTDNNNGIANDLDRSNGTSQQAISSSPPPSQSSTSGNNNNNVDPKPPLGYKKSWGGGGEEDSNLPEWATESFDYGGTFDSSGAFHDSDRVGGGGGVASQVVNNSEVKMKKEEEIVQDPSPVKFMNFLNDETPPPVQDQQQQNLNQIKLDSNGSSAPIAQMDKLVENFVTRLIMDDETTKPVVPPLIEWFYRDPQGDTQGPFTSADMSEWYKAGYFQESLMVRRSIDSAFIPLGHLVKTFGPSRPFIIATLDGGPPIPPAVQLDQLQFRMQQPPPPQLPPQQQQQQQQPDNWSLMTSEQRMFFMQLAAHQQRPLQPPPPQPPQPVPSAIPPVDPFVMKPQNSPLDLRRIMAGNGPADFYQSQAAQSVVQQPPPPQPPQQQQVETDPIQQLIMQLQMQQKTGNIDANQWMKPAPSPQQQNQIQQQQMMEMVQQQPPPPQPPSHLQQQQQQQQVQNSSSHWSGTQMTIWDLGGKEQQQQSQQIQQHEEIQQNGLIDDQQMQKVESKKNKKKEVVKDPPKPQLQQQSQQMQQIDKKSNNKVKKESKKEERTTQPAAPAPWVGHQPTIPNTSLTKIQKTEAQRRQVELAAQSRQQQQQQQQQQENNNNNRNEVKWNLQVSQVKTLDEIQAEEQQNAAEKEAKKGSASKEVMNVVVGDIWNTGAHSMAWQQPKAWSASGGQSNAGFWEDPVKVGVKQATQMLSKSQTMATISTAKRNVPVQAQKKVEGVGVSGAGKKKKEDKKKEEVNNEFTIWCTRTLHAMNGNVDIPTFVSFLQDLESPFEVKDYIKMYLGETKECTEFAKQFLERRSKHRAQQRQLNAHIDDMCSPAPAINPQANSSSSEFQEVKGKNKKVKAKKVMKAVDNRILGFTATSAEGRINVGDRDYGDS